MFIIYFLKKVCNLRAFKQSIPIHVCCSHVSKTDSSKMDYLVEPVSTPANK